MNDQDKVYLRHLFAMFTLNGVATRGISGGENLDHIAENCYRMADAMLRASETKEEGIVAIKKRTRT